MTRTALAFLLLATAALPAHAGSRFDGMWRVTTSAEDGSCNQNYDFKLSVKNGKVTYAGFWPVKATGGITKVGVVDMRLAHGGQHVVAKGLVSGDEASGDWSSPHHPRCSGSWIARKA